MKLKHCPECDQDLPRESFTSTHAKYCNPCKRIRQLKQAQERNQRQIDKLKNKTPKKVTKIRISDLKKSVQRAFNKWIRERDVDLPCISCQKDSDTWDAGHYLSQGSSGYLRYEPKNVHKQCRSCNRFKHGNLIEYRINLIAKIGESAVKQLEADRTKTKKWTREELTELLEKYH